MAKQKTGYLIGLVFLLGGCATVDQRAGFSEIGAIVQERSGMTVSWNKGTELDAEAAQKVRSLLSDKLNADEAVQVSLR